MQVQYTVQWEGIIASKVSVPYPQLGTKTGPITAVNIRLFGMTLCTLELVETSTTRKYIIFTASPASHL
jgi:hypothetical protein